MVHIVFTLVCVIYLQTIALSVEAEDQLFQCQGRSLEQGGEKEGSQEGRHGVAHEQVNLEQDFK